MRDLATDLGAEHYRADQIFRWVHNRAVDSFEEMTDLGKELRARLAERARLGCLDIDLEQVSRDGTRKLRLRTHDGRAIETVLIPDGDQSAQDDERDDEAAEHGWGSERSERGTHPRAGRLMEFPPP